MFEGNFYTSNKTKNTGYSKNKSFSIYFKNPELLEKKKGNFKMTCDVSFMQGFLHYSSH